MSASLLQERINPICAQSDSILIKVHPILKHRDDVFNKKGDFLAEQDLYGDLFEQKGKNHTMDLSAYPSYFKDCPLPIKAKSAIDTLLIFASPLLNSKERGIYLMQYFEVDNYYWHELGRRILFAKRYYNKYKWKKGRLEFVEKLHSEYDYFNPFEGLPIF